MAMDTVPAVEDYYEGRNRREAESIAKRKAELLAEWTEKPDDEKEDDDQNHFLHEIMERAHRISDSAKGYYADYLVSLRCDMARAISTSLGLTDEQFFGIMTGTHSVLPVEHIEAMRGPLPLKPEEIVGLRNRTHLVVKLSTPLSKKN